MNPNVPIVDITLDRPRKLIYNYGAFAHIQRSSDGRIKLMGKDAVEGWQALLAGGPEEDVLLLWAGLIRDDPKLTRLQVEDMMSLDNMAYIQAKVQEALTPILESMIEKGKESHPQTAIVNQSSGSDSKLSPVFVSASDPANSTT